MIRARPDGPRLGELFLAEVVGRELGPLGRVAVAGLDRPTGFTCQAGDRYDVEVDGVVAATVAIDPGGVELTLVERGSRIRFERGETVKAALDALVAATT